MTTAASNSKLSEGDRQKLFAHMFRQILNADLKRREAVADIKSVKKLAKSYDESFTAQKFEHFLKIHFGEDDQKPVDRLRSDRENCEWAGLIKSTSGGDLLAQVDRVDGEQFVQAKGYLAGLLSQDRVSGYDGGSSDDRMWLESYDAAKAELNAELPDILARIEAARTNEEPAPDTDNPFGDEPTAEAAE